MLDWKTFRVYFRDGELEFTKNIAKLFPKNERNLIRSDFEWFGAENLRKKAFQILEELEDMEQNKYAKKEEFYYETGTKLIQIVKYDRLDGKAINAKFTDSKGMVNRLTFRDVVVGEDGCHVQEQERTIDSTSWSFFFAYKNAKVNAGDIVLVTNLSLNNPLSPNGNAREWIFRLAQRTPKEEKVIDYNETQDDGNTT